MQNRNLSKPIITNKKAQIRNQTLFQHQASSHHKKLEGPPEIGTIFLSRGLGVYGRVYFVWFAETAHKAHHGTFHGRGPWSMTHGPLARPMAHGPLAVADGPWAMAHGPWPWAMGHVWFDCLIVLLHVLA